MLAMVETIEVESDTRDLFAILRMACSRFRKKYGFNGNIIPTEVRLLEDNGHSIKVGVKIEVQEKIGKSGEGFTIEW